MKSLLLTCLLTLLTGLAGRAWAQDAAAACGNGRYVADLPTTIVQTSGIVYGQNTVHDYSNNTDTPQTLLLDFYEPANDNATQRPLIIFAFGGSFVSGTRQTMDDLCRAFAQKGYTTATIDYRLVPPGANCPSYLPNCNQVVVGSSKALLADQIVRASSDMKAAVRFFRHDAATSNTYRIDPTKIIVAGYSAGAITALETAYIDREDEDKDYYNAYQANGGLEGNTDLPAPNNLLPNYNARNLTGAFSLAGAVTRLSIVGPTNPPLYAAHGDADNVVPYNSGQAFGSSPYTLYGGGALHARADTVGLTNQLYTITGGDHSSTRQEPYRTAINTAAALFFQQLICSAPLPVTLVSFEAQRSTNACAPTLHWRTASELNSQAYEVQRSADGRTFATLGTVPSRNSPTGADYSFEAGAVTGAAYYRLKIVDIDNALTYSPVVSIAACATSSLTLLPNPTGGQVVVGSLPAEPCQVRVYSAAGQLVAQATGSSAVPLNLADLPAGLYLVQAATASGAPLGQARLVKQ